MERVTLSVLAVLSVLTVVSCEIRIDDRSTTEANLEAEAREAILDQLRAYYRDFSALDSAAFASHFWPGADITTAWQPPGARAVRVVIQPVETFIAQWDQGPGSRPIFEERMRSAEVKVHGDLAQVWARYEARFGDTADLMEWEGIDAFTLMRADDRWRIVELAFTGTGEGSER